MKETTITEEVRHEWDPKNKTWRPVEKTVKTVTVDRPEGPMYRSTWGEGKTW